MPSLIVWMLNGVVMAAVLAKLFVFGEPVTKPLTASSVSYWRSRRQADVYLAAVSLPSFLYVSNGFLSFLFRLTVWQRYTNFTSGIPWYPWLIGIRFVKDFYLAHGSGCEVLCLCVCLSVCLSARISPEPHAWSLPNFCACCLWPWLGTLWACCDTLCTSSFVDGIMFFSIMGRIAVWPILLKFAHLPQSRT